MAWLSWPCWEPYKWSGYSRGACGQIMAWRKIIFVPGMCFQRLFRKRGRRCPWCATATVPEYFGSESCGSLGCQDFPGKAFSPPALAWRQGQCEKVRVWMKSVWRCHSQARLLQGTAGNATLSQDPGRDWTMVWSERDPGFIDWVLSPRGTGHLAMLLSEDDHSDFTQHHAWKSLISKDLLNALNTSSSWIPVCKEMFHIILDHRNVWWQFNSLLLCNV